SLPAPALHGPVHPAQAGLPHLGPLREPADAPADGAGRILRHLLLPSRVRLLRAAPGPGSSAPGVGEPLRLRAVERDRHRPRGARTAADARVAPGHVHEGDRPVLLADRPPVEAGRLDPARDRPEGPARDAAPDGALLRT